MTRLNHRTGRLLLGLLCCLSGGAAETIRVNGSGSALAMLKPLVAAYGKTSPGVVVDIGKPLGSSGAMKALLAGALDVAVTSRPLAPEEAAQGAQWRNLGQTPLLIVTGKAVGKNEITSAELAAIYAGETKVWPNGQPIRVILRPEGDIDTQILAGLSPAMQSAIALAHQREGMILALTDPESNEAVARVPGSIGAAGLCGLEGHAVSLNVLTLNGVQPSLKTLASGAYPLAKGIDFVTTGRTSAAGRRLLDFIFSATGRAIAEKAGVLPAAP